MCKAHSQSSHLSYYSSPYIPWPAEPELWLQRLQPPQLVLGPDRLLQSLRLAIKLVPQKRTLPYVVSCRRTTVLWLSEKLCPNERRLFQAPIRDSRGLRFINREGTTCVTLLVSVVQMDPFQTRFSDGVAVGGDMDQSANTSITKPCSICYQSRRSLCGHQRERTVQKRRCRRIKLRPGL